MIINTKRSFILLITAFTIFFIILAISGFIKYNIATTSKEFHKDLATIRGYWALYGARELNTSVVYPYYRLTSGDILYEINVSKSENDYSWTIINDGNSGVKNNDIFRRDLNASDTNTTIKYSY
jgi:hypothetical protein